MPESKTKQIILRQDGTSLDAMTAEARIEGDPGLYDEIRTVCYSRDGNAVADVLVGLTADNELRFRIAYHGERDDERVMHVFPMRPDGQNVEFGA